MGRGAPMAKAAEYAGRYRAALVRKVADSRAEVTDAWGTKVQLSRPPWAQQTYFVMRSAGPDKQFNTPDDVVAGLIARTKIVGRPSAGASAVDVNVEHDRGAFNGRAEVTGVVVDQQGGAVEGATVTLTATDGNQRAGACQ